MEIKDESKRHKGREMNIKTQSLVKLEVNFEVKCGFAAICDKCGSVRCSKVESRVPFCRGDSDLKLQTELFSPLSRRKNEEPCEIWDPAAIRQGK